MAIISSQEKQKHEGSSRTKGSYSIEEINNDIAINLHLSVRKSGVSGTGKGALIFGLLGSDSNQPPILNKVLTKTVGANALTGVAEKHIDESLTMLKSKWDQVTFIAFGVTTTDGIGFPTSLPEWKDLIGEELGTVLGGLGLGEMKEVADFVFKKVK
ncbi:MULTISPECIES: hypothetical protein [Bacillus]|uniref:hypothetical protein n=1 Tax=Bacillus TaxID=1386 RepID=UPI002E1C9B55|nr:MULTISPECIES: hypothetical protein [Bacillus]MED4562760.1 hypothetical protein [Bacillus altitudinis]MED5223192.1 hypothetical protein [Bacillus safensis]